MVTTAPAPVVASAPTVTGATNIVSQPIKAPAPMLVRCLSRPSELHVPMRSPSFAWALMSVSPTQRQLPITAPAP